MCWIAQNLAPIMFAALIFFAARLPGRFLAGRQRPGFFFGRGASSSATQGSTFLQALPERIFGIMSNDLLLAIPFFTFMGAILERCGLAEDLLDGTASCSARCAAASPMR